MKSCLFDYFQIGCALLAKLLHLKRQRQRMLSIKCARLSTDDADTRNKLVQQINGAAYTLNSSCNYALMRAEIQVCEAESRAKALLHNAAERLLNLLNTCNHLKREVRGFRLIHASLEFCFLKMHSNQLFMSKNVIYSSVLIALLIANSPKRHLRNWQNTRFSALKHLIIVWWFYVCAAVTIFRFSRQILVLHINWFSQSMEKGMSCPC